MKRKQFLKKCSFTKFTMLLLLWFVVSHTFAQITVTIRNKPLREVLKEIEKVSEYKFFYNESLPGLTKNTTIRLTNSSVDTALQQLLSNTGIEYRKGEDNVIALVEKIIDSQNTAPTQSKQTPVKGRIVDAAGEPVIGATIIEKGNSSNGIVSDFDGNFTINVPAGAILKISYMGYQEQEVPATGKTSVSIVLQEDTQMLDELVVVGYTVQRRESLTGSLQSISNTKLKDITTPSVENMLNGKAPGVYVAPGSGQPGQTGTIVIRGKSTINGSTDPLWVIDGVIVGNNAGSLNPADIETMTILKDAASTAIYGSQGANGVIVVTTRNPRADKLTISLSAKAGTSSLVKGNLEVMNGQELYDYYKSFANKEVVKFGVRTEDDVKNSNFNWWDLAAQTGFVQEYNLTVSGGSEKLRSLMSIGVYDESGSVKGFQFTRYNFLYKTDFRPYDWLAIKPFISGARRDIDDRQYSVSSMYSALPWDSPYDRDGNLVPHKSKLWVNSNSTNYLYDLQWNFNKSTMYEFMVNFDFDIKLTNWLTFSSVNNIKYQGFSAKGYQDPKSNDALGVKGRVSENRNELLRRYTNQLLRINKVFGKHALNGLLAYEYNDYKYVPLEAKGTGVVPGFHVLDVVAMPEATKGNITEWAVQSVFSNINYAYDNKYLAQLSLRRDGASNFGTNAKYGNFFSISGGWNIHREDFFKNDFVNELKLRVSYGSVGNRPSALYPQYDLYGVSSTVSYNGVPGALISQVGNRELTWEKSYTTGIGIDATLFDRLRMTLDIYDKNTSDLLYEIPISGVTGVTSYWRNVGEVNNKGVEFTASVDVIKNKNLLWTIDANIGLNRNKVTKLYGVRDENGKVAPIKIGDGSGVAGSAEKILREGGDADTWWLKEWAGVNKENGAPMWYTGKMVKDANGNETRETTSKYADAAFVEAGAYTPDFFGGFSTALYWKNFDANMVFGYSVGGKIYNYSRAEYDSDGAYTDRNQMRLMPGWSRWQKPGDIATHPLASYNNKTHSNKVSTRYLEDGTYLKLRSVSLGYNFALPQYHLQNIRIFLTGENLFTLTGYSGVDPEIPTYEDRYGIRKITGVTTTVYPSTRKFMLGFNLTF